MGGGQEGGGKEGPGQEGCETGSDGKHGDQRIEGLAHWLRAPKGAVRFRATVLSFELFVIDLALECVRFVVNIKTKS